MRLSVYRLIPKVGVCLLALWLINCAGNSGISTGASAASPTDTSQMTSSAPDATQPDGAVSTQVCTGNPEDGDTDENHKPKCRDADGDGYYSGCQKYNKPHPGPDCDDSNPNVWNSCGKCVDQDGDGFYTGCDDYKTIKGPDCDDSNANVWSSCGKCVDNDGDGSYAGCDAYTTIKGPDCDDSNSNVWQSCGKCVDMDGDGSYIGCDSYKTIKGPDCDDSNPNIYPNAPEICDGVDNQCPGDSGYGMVDEVCSWAVHYGGNLADSSNCVQQTSDGGYIVAGQTQSYGHGGWDFWVFKLDLLGQMEWQQVLGGANEDAAWSVVESNDHGYVVAGYTRSMGAGAEDVWVVKFDSAGKQVWSKLYGGTARDMAMYIDNTTDGGYAVVGETSGKIWLIKLDDSGNMVWNKTYASGRGRYVRQTSDGGFIIVGYGGDFYVVKTDANGNKVWEKYYGGSGSDLAFSVQETPDHGFAVAGWTTSWGAGSTDYMVVKLDAAGNKLWQQTYGGSGSEGSSGIGNVDIANTDDGGMILLGFTQSFGAGAMDYWVFKINAFGDLEWAKTFGGKLDDNSAFIRQTSDGGYIMCGFSASFGTNGSWDAWILKLDPQGNCTGPGCPPKGSCIGPGCQ